MSNAEQLAARERVIAEFLDACPEPTGEQILAWVGRHPEHADEIRATAVAALELLLLAEAADEAGPPPTPVDGGSDARRGRAGRPAAVPLLQAIAAAGTDIPALARKLGIPRILLADVAAGRVMPPISHRLLTALSHALSLDPSAVDGAVMAAFLAPSAAHAYAEAPAQPVARPFRSAVEDSGMDLEQQRLWLDEA